jgi:DNA repair photolyase
MKAYTPPLLQLEDQPGGVQGIPSLLSRAPDPALIAGLEEDLAVRFLRYFYTCPGRPDRPLGFKSRLLSLYDPFARRSQFPAGRRLCANVYVGCSHGCRYCYTTGYISDARRPRPKEGFSRLLQRDIADLKNLDLPPMPLHISNSTDAFMDVLEDRHGHTLSLLQTLVEEQSLFSFFTFLTKNPARLARPEYLSCLARLEHVRVEVSLIFWDDARRKELEPGAPSVQSRLDAIRQLRAAGVSVALRIDPLFPRDPLPREFFSRETVADYGATSPHTFEDLANLVEFAVSTRCTGIIISPLKVPCGRWHDSQFRSSWLPVFADANGGKPAVRTFAYRLPTSYIHEGLAQPLVDLGRKAGIQVVYCKANLIGTA